MPVFLQLVIDGNGESEVISVFLITSEDGEAISGLLDIFKQHNPAWNEIQTVLSDKDFTESSLQAALPAGKLTAVSFSCSSFHEA